VGCFIQWLDRPRPTARRRASRRAVVGAGDRYDCVTATSKSTAQSCQLRQVSNLDASAQRERAHVSVRGRDGEASSSLADPGPRIHPYPFIQQTRKGTKVKQTRLILGPIPPPGPGDRLRPCVVGGGWPPCGAGAPPTAWRRSRSRSSASCRRYPSVPSLLLARWVFHGRPEIRKGGAFSGVRFVPGVARLRDVPLICVPRG
jgi:hypothetical protein